jgi:dTDP-4-amino-4,6-dideoxygalactose transaminase
MSIKVPFVALGRQFEAYEPELIEIFRSVGRSGAYVHGPQVAEFEEAAAKACGVSHAVAVANGTDALILPLRSWGIGPGDEVITAPNSFIASAGAIAAVGAQIRFADIEEDLNISPAAIEKAITKKTKAIMPVHLTGRPARMDEINAIARAHNLFVIEDAAQAIGASLNGRPVGSLGHAAGFSLHPLKNLHVHGDGGFITTNDEKLAQHLRILRNHGLLDRDTCSEWALNSRLDSLHAAIGTFKFKHLDAWTRRFREIADRYREGLKDCVRVPVDRPGEVAVYHNFVVLADRRDELMAYLLARGVETKIHYPILLHLQPAARGLGYKEGDFPVAEATSKKQMSLPIYPELREDEIVCVIEAIRSFYGV